MAFDMSEGEVADTTSCQVVLHRDGRTRRDRAIRYGVRIDGSSLGKLRNGETQTFAARPGDHDLQVTSYRFFTSSRLAFSLREGQSAEFDCGPGGSSFTLVFDVIFRPRRYLSLTGPK